MSKHWKRVRKSFRCSENRADFFAVIFVFLSYPLKNLSEQSEQNTETSMNACFPCSDIFKKRSDKPHFVPTIWGNSGVLCSDSRLIFRDLRQVLMRKYGAEVILLPPYRCGKKVYWPEVEK